MIRDGLKLRDVKVEKVERKQSNGPRPVGNNKFDIDGYTFYGHNRLTKHHKAKRGSGGVGIFVKSSIEEKYKVNILDKTAKGILWLKFDNEQETFCVCVCYLPPKGSSRSNDPEQFYVDLTNQVYMYQNIGQMYIVGDFNSRCSDISDFIEGVDDVTPREVIDYSSNTNGDLLIDFLVDCNLCMLNGRKGKQDFTCISKRGKSVVDFIITTHENIHMCTDFDVKIMSDITNELELQDMNQIPDHSVLTVSIKRESANQQDKTPLASYSDIQKLPSKPRSRTIPNEFLNDDTVRVKIEQVIQNIENNLTVKQDVDAAYGCFVELISDEVKSKIGEKSEGDNQYRKAKGKSRYKPYWNDNLKLLWDKTCEHEKVWLKWKGCGTKKKRVREQFLTSRNAFDKLLRKEKRSYQLRQQQELLNLSTENNTRDFWKKIGKLGIANDRRSSEGNVCKDIKTVYDTWKCKYEHLFNVTDSKYDEDLLCTVQHQLENEIINLSGKDSEILNNDVSYDDVGKAVYRAKLNKAGGLDQICAEFLRNNSCVNILFKIIKFAFDNGVVPATWNNILINPILKPDKDYRDPLGYRGIALMSIPCKIYADILNTRLSSWLEENNILADEQNGFRKDRGCIEHLYSLTSIITNRKIERLSTFACFIDAKKPLIL
ncbi:uncharacterized protein LOC134697591 [Mytilus trossulus]|uniref:uncharacterized protein LOC134697591 n=1 Tax=Mytilus trossulus TaxID=6551 RepID=UPI003006C39A